MIFDKNLSFLTFLDHWASVLTLSFAIIIVSMHEFKPKVVKNHWFYQKVQNLLSKALPIFLPAGHRCK